MSIAIVTNEASGTGGGSREELEEAIRQAGVSAEVVTPAAGQDLTSLARDQAKRGYGTVVAGGGDGTVSAVAGALVGTDCTLGILPLGTLNHLAKDLGIPLDLPGALDVLASGRATRIDIAEVNGQFFVNNSSLGLYPVFVANRERQQREFNRPKWRAAIGACLAALRVYPMLHVRISLDGRTLDRRTPLLFVGNNQYEFQGLGAGGRKCIDEGKLCFLVTHTTHRLALMWLAFKALLGRLDRATDFDALSTSQLDVHVRRHHVAVAMDGEVRMLDTPLRYRIHPRALRVIVPPDAASVIRRSTDANAAASV